MTDTPNSPTEITPEGEQFIAPGVGPVTLADRLAVRAAQPIAPRRNQIDLLDLLRPASDGGAPNPKPKE